MTSESQRVVQLTFHKCGSQWVRDVLTSAPIQKYSGITSVGSSYGLRDRPWVELVEGTFTGPVYNVAPADWAAHRQPGDRAIVVLRDPRDRLISWMFSAAHSHVPSPSVRFWRDLLLPMNNHSRILTGMLELSGIVPIFEAWGREPNSEHTFITTYEKLVAEQVQEFRRIVDFLGWEIPQDVLEREVKNLSFSSRSGRERGEENVFSHYRKGEPGDWRRYFDREMGLLWEQRMPGLLTQLGYEANSDWPQTLPAVAEVASAEEMSQHDLTLELNTLNAAAVRREEEWAAYQLSDKNRRRFFRRRIKRLRKLIRKLREKPAIRCLRWLAKTRRRCKRLLRGGA